MRFTKLAIACALLGAAGQAQADTVFGVYAGAQGWDMSTAGGFADQSTITNFNFDSKTNNAIYVAVEHPIPFVPNVKLNRTQLDTSGSTLLTTSFTFDGELFTVDSNVDTTIDMTTTDVVLYFELFDNDLVSFDLGVNAKYVDGTLLVTDEDANLSGQETFSGVVPMGYSRLEVGLPFTGLGAYAEGSYLAIDDSTVSDFQVALTYSFIESLALDMTVQLGYRDMTVELDDLDDIYSDLSFDGVFAGVELHF